MEYVLVGLVGNVKYYLQQDKKFQWLMNGLLDNARRFPSENATKTPRQLAEKKFKIKLHIMEVKPVSK